jgi:diacylglycerol kinase (ATP)
VVQFFYGKQQRKAKVFISKRTKSFKYAGRGVCLHLQTTHNSWIQIFIFFCVVALGLFLGITKIEWLFVILASGLVFVSEAFNTAIEIDIDLTSPEFHPCAKNTKDVAAGAVLISSIIAAAVGLIIFVPYFL